jgi:hypothetical protein
MTAHSTPSKEDNEHSLPNQPFFGWLYSQTTLFYGQLISLISTAYLIFALFYYSDPHHKTLWFFLTPSAIQKFVYWAHIIFILYFIYRLLKILDENKIGSYRTGMVYRRIFNDNLSPEEISNMKGHCNNGVKKFKLYFLLFWISMLALYLSFLSNDINTTKQYVKTQTHSVSSKYYEVKGDKNFNEVQFTQIINTDSIETIGKNNGKDLIKTGDSINEKDLGFRTTKFTEAFIHVAREFLTYSLNNISLLFVFWCFTILYSPPVGNTSKKKQSKLIYFSSFIIGILIIAFPILFKFVFENSEYSHSNIFGYLTLFNAISGILNAIALALLIARLDSKFIALPSWLVAVLYTYAAVQPLFVAFDQPDAINEVIKTAVLLIVFIFKIYFFFIILYIMQTGRLYSYLFCFPTLNKRVDAIFENQLEIFTREILTTDLKFRYEIMKGAELLFKTDELYDDREECRLYIEELRNCAKQKDNFEILESTGGTYLVKIYNSEKKLFCFSSNLTSYEEADDIVDETMEKLPYCKYDYS